MKMPVIGTEGTVEHLCRARRKLRQPILIRRGRGTQWCTQRPSPHSNSPLVARGSNTHVW